jgi:hypothetical protein
VKRWLVLACAVVLGAAAPARAWCEATCVAPPAAGESHCPSHDPADATTTISATVVDECPVLESARPAVPARIDADAALASAYTPAVSARQYAPASFAARHGAAGVFRRSIPLRI